MTSMIRFLLLLSVVGKISPSPVTSIFAYPWKREPFSCLLFVLTSIFTLPSLSLSLFCPACSNRLALNGLILFLWYEQIEQMPVFTLSSQELMHQFSPCFCLFLPAGDNICLTSVSVYFLLGPFSSDGANVDKYNKL